MGLLLVFSASIHLAGHRAALYNKELSSPKYQSYEDGETLKWLVFRVSSMEFSMRQTVGICYQNEAET